MLKRITKHSIVEFLDKLIPKNSSYWIMPVYFIGKGDFSDNILAVYETVKKDPSIKKIILTREKQIEADKDSKNVVILPMNSLLAVWFLLRSKVIFVQHSVWLDLKAAKFQIHKPLNRYIINLWHGIAPKDMTHDNTGIINERSKLEMPNYINIVSSQIDLENKQKAFFLSKKENFWMTGNPRNDFLLTPEELLPKTLQNELTKLKNMVGEKKLLVYAPTYKETNVNGGYYHFNENELKMLDQLLRQKNMIMGIRYHTYRRPAFYKDFFKYSSFYDLSSEVISDFRVIMRVAEALITDYSSVYVDAVYLNKKCISFSYDLDHYKEIQRGFMAPFESIFPGPICKNFSSLFNEIENLDSQLNEKEKIQYSNVRNLLFKHIDSNNADRVVTLLKKII